MKRLSLFTITRPSFITLTLTPIAAVLLLASITTIPLSAQTAAAQAAAKTGPYAAIPADDARQTNPVKSSPESLDRGKKWWALDCAMCHGKDGNGKGSLATDMKLKMSSLTDPATLKDRTDGELFYLIHKGYGDMPPEGDRIKTETTWDLVNYVRSLSSPAMQKP
jgi:mono/diheme cytochrome c family protein